MPHAFVAKKCRNRHEGKDLMPFGAVSAFFSMEAIALAMSNSVNGRKRPQTRLANERARGILKPQVPGHR